MKRFGAHFGTTDEKVNATGLITQARQSRWKLLAPTRVKLPNEFQTTSALHACPARKMHPRKTNVRAVVRPRALRDGNRHRSKFAKKKKSVRREEERETAKKKRRKERQEEDRGWREKRGNTRISRPSISDATALSIASRTVDPLSTGGFMENDALRKLRARRGR